MKLFHRILYGFSLFTIFLTFLFLIYIAYQLFFPIKTITFDPGPYPVTHKELKPGDIIEYRVKFCRYLDAPISVTRTLVDGLVYLLPVYEQQRNSGCYDLLVDTTRVPEELPSGTYHMHLSYTMNVNEFRHVNIMRETEEFRVTNSKESKL